MGSMKDLFGDTPYVSPSLPAPKRPETRSRADDPSTSSQAAKAAAGKFTTIQSIVLKTHQQITAGLTDLDLQQILKDTRSTYRTRRAELVEAGLLMDSGVRRNQEGSNRIVWKLTERGRAVVL